MWGVALLFQATMYDKLYIRFFLFSKARIKFSLLYISLLLKVKNLCYTAVLKKTRSI